MQHREMMRISIATDSGWFELKLKLTTVLKAIGYEIADIGAYELVSGDNYPDFVVPIIISETGYKKTNSGATGISSTDICATVNKIPGVFAALIKNTPAFFQEIESNDMAVKCLGGQIKGYALSSNKVLTFPNAVINTDIEFNQCLAKVNVLAKEINA